MDIRNRASYKYFQLYYLLLLILLTSFLSLLLLLLVVTLIPLPFSTSTLTPTVLFSITVIRLITAMREYPLSFNKTQVKVLILVIYFHLLFRIIYAVYLYIDEILRVCKETGDDISPLITIGVLDLVMNIIPGLIMVWFVLYKDITINSKKQYLVEE